MVKKKKRKANKGFTLVEVIVVLVILAILAALLVPSLIGYIKKAEQQQVIAECRNAVMAAQTLYSEAYANKETVSVDAIKELAEVPGTIKDPVEAPDYLILHLVYTNAPYTVTYCRDYETCSEHEKRYNLTETGGSGGGNEPSEDPDTGGETGGGDSVTLNGTDGNQYVLKATNNWDALKLKMGNWVQLAPGSLLSDGTNVYVVCSDMGFSGNYDTLTALADANKSKVVKIDNNANILTSADVTGNRWNHDIKKNDIYVYTDENNIQYYYVAKMDMTDRTTVPTTQRAGDWYPIASPNL